MNISLYEVGELNLELLRDRGKTGDLLAEFRLGVLAALELQRADVSAVVEVYFGLDDLEVVHFGKEGFLF